MSDEKYPAIVINTDSWHYCLFKFGHKIWCKFWGNDYYDYKYYVTRNQNLCKYLRTILIKLPLILAVTLSTYAMFIYTFLIFPFKYISASYINFWGLISIIVLCGFVAVFAIIELFKGISKIYDRLKKDNIALVPEIKIQKPPSFWKICMTYLQDRHNQFCRFIIFNEPR